MAKRKKRFFTPEQKAEFVRIALESDKPMSQVAKDLGIAHTTLSKWIRESDERGVSLGARALGPEEREELTRLRRENKQLKAERDVLKKSVAFFARESA